jgi:hypothetical protein
LKEILGIISSLIAIASYIPYLRHTLQGKTKPHLVTWFLWAIVATLSGIIQLQGGAYAGAWVTIATGISVIAILIAGFFKGDRYIKRMDWVCLILGIFAVVAWLVSKQPLLSLVLLCIVDVFAFAPTYRKAFHKPQEETLTTYILAATKYVFALAALGNYSVQTMLYPLCEIVLCGIMIGLLFVRRKQI